MTFYENLQQERLQLLRNRGAEVIQTPNDKVLEKKSGNERRKERLSP